MTRLNNLVPTLLIGAAALICAPAAQAGPHDSILGGLKNGAPASLVEKVHKQNHGSCYLHAKWPEMACHRHVYLNKKWTVQNCRPEDCVGMTVKGGKQQKKITDE